MTTLPTLFETFLSDIRPQDEHNDAYKEGHETLRDHLQNDDGIDEFYVADFLQGSYRRWTSLKPQKDEKSDVDVVFVSDLNSDLDTDVALGKCEPFLEDHYEGQWEPNAHSYKIEEEEVEIDLVLTAAPSEATREVVKSLGSLDVGTALSPDDLSTVAEALNISADGDEWKDEPLKIPHRDENEWENTHPLATIAFTVNKNDITDGHYVNVVKAIKWWRRTKTPDVVATEMATRRPGFRRDEETVLAVDVDHIDRVTLLARQARQLNTYPVGDLACFNVDFAREFRYCLEEDVDPTPASELSTLRLSVPVTETGADTYAELSVDGDTVTGSPTDILTAVQTALEDQNPDILVCSTSEIIPTLYEMAAAAGVDGFTLSRWPDIDYQQLASRSTYSSYGRVGHSPARYNVPGRAIIDESNTFFYGETNLDGVLDLVSRSKKPVQELAWASIGNVLTAIQICEAHDRGVLVPWNSWRHEFYKPMGTLHDADRGGFIFAPEVGVHGDVHELDFSSLYPNIICTRNVSPDVIGCDCHSDRDDVPGLGYSICNERGYLVNVLQPIIDARDEIKAAIRREQQQADPDEERLAELEGRSGALKWILVACFGYQGFSNAKFGRIECHEAINAYAREILVAAKQRLEAGGWRVVHGIVDSIWVTPDPDVDDDDREDLKALATEITEDVEIRLEHESHYDWVAFVPQRESNAGALTKYFGKVAGADEFKVRGIEARQRSTPPFIEKVQRECLERFDAAWSPEAVLVSLRDAIDRLHAEKVPTEGLVERNRVSKPLEGYTQNTQNVAALKRARDQDLAVHPGQDIEYVVVDDEKTSREQVALAHEEIETYDASYYETQLIRAVESVLSPLGWDRLEIRRELAETREMDLTEFTANPSR